MQTMMPQLPFEMHSRAYFAPCLVSGFAETAQPAPCCKPARSSHHRFRALSLLLCHAERKARWLTTSGTCCELRERGCAEEAGACVAGRGSRDVTCPEAKHSRRGCKKLNNVTTSWLVALRLCVLRIHTTNTALRPMERVS